MGDLLLPVGAELLHSTVQLLTQLAVDISRRVVTRAAATTVVAGPKRDLIELCDCRFGWSSQIAA